jgi:hypothetical protein
MGALVCANCGAPLDVTAAAAALGYVKCPYCSGSTPLAQPARGGAEADAPPSPFVRVGSDNVELLPADLDAVAERPPFTRIDLTQKPGEHFRLLMPRKNVLAVVIFAATLAGGVGGGGIGVVAAVTAVAAGFGYGWLAFAISSAVVVVALAVGAWYLVRIARGRNEIAGRGGKLRVVKRGITVTTAEYPLTAATDLAFDPLDETLDGTPAYCLGLNTESGRMPLPDFFLSCTAGQQRWIRTEWRHFHESIRRGGGPE